MAKITFVAHRYYPYPGGTENTVRRAAEAMLHAGHEVAVYAGGNKGDQNGVKVGFDASLVYSRDLVVVHGSGVFAQDQILTNIKHIDSPILHWLIRPDDTLAQSRGMFDCALLGWTTKYDVEYAKTKGVDLRKLHYVPHVITDESLGKLGFKNKYNIRDRMFLSSGGFWRHKGHQELIDVFENNIHMFPDTTLVITGYTGENHGLTHKTNKVKVFYIHDISEVYSAMREADLYIMNSFDEGFGLVIIEAMLNSTPWIARHIAGADSLQHWGKTYIDKDGLLRAMANFTGQENVEAAREYILREHCPAKMVESIESAIKKLQDK